MSENLIRSFVDLLWQHPRRPEGSRYPEGFFSLWTLPGKHSYHFKLDDPELAARAFELDQGGNNVFFGLGLRKADLGTFQRGKREDISALPGFWSDIDIQGLTHKADNLPAGIYDVITAILQPFPWEPSMVVASGGGIHAYWLFDQPLIITDENRAEVEEMSRVFQERLAMHARAKNWKWDMTADLPRVLRVVGTHNRKIPERPVPVTFLGTPGRMRYSYAMICQGLKTRAAGIASILGREDVRMPALNPGESVPPRTVDNRSAEEIQLALREKMRKNRKADRTDTIKQILEGEPFAVMGERDRMLQKVCSWIAFWDMHADPEILAEVLEKSLDAMAAAQPDGAMTMDDAVEKIARAQADARRKAFISDGAQKAIENVLQRQARGLLSKPKPPPLTALPGSAPEPQPVAPLAPRSTGVSSGQAPTPPALTLVEKLTSDSQHKEKGEEQTGRLTPEEIQSFITWQSELSGNVITWEGWKKRWVICYGDARYIFGGHGRYKPPISKNNLRHSIPRDVLCVLPEWDKDGSYYFQPKTIKADHGLRVKSPDEIIDEIGTVARHIVADMSISEGYYDADSETFFESVATVRRDLEPRYDQNIQTWLELLGRESGQPDVDKLLDWIATLTRLDSPNCGLFISGPPDVGKSMLANGLARLWYTGGYTRMEEVTGSFNADLATCPLVVADEALPETQNGRPISTRRLRDMISADTRTLRRKFMPNVPLKGCVRVMFLANSPRLFDLADETLGTDSLRAVASRLLHIHSGKEPAEFIKSIGGRAGGTRNWVTGNEIAMHALWLRDNRQVVPAGRFLVEGHQTKMHEMLATASAVNGMVVEWVIRHLIRCKPEVKNSGGVLVGNGQVLVNSGTVFDHWGHYITNRGSTTPALSKISKALEALSTAPKAERMRSAKTQMTFWPLRIPTLLGWAAENGLGDPEALLALINTPVEGGFKNAIP